MSTKTASPTARLLRESRFFSLPKPLPWPPSSTSDLSPTTPTPYPIQQAIRSPRSSRARGDWGLKRPLPLRSTNRASNPTLRLNAIDTIEHITDFDSASDHTLTLRKFSELNLPVTQRGPRHFIAREASTKSVFEKTSDRTVKTVDGQAIPPSQRWKFDGPWLANLSQGEFIEYLEKAVQPRRAEFLAFLREQHARNAEKERQCKKREQEQDDDFRTDDATAPPASDTTSTSKALEELEASFQSWLRNLRSTTLHLDSELFALLAQFLDLPGMPFPAASTSSSRFAPRSPSELMASSEIGTTAPPATHRSAGLSYLRSDAYLENHPLLGPQAERSPHQARVLRETNNSAASAATRQGFVGLAGFSAAGPAGGRTAVTQPGSNARASNPMQARRDEKGETTGLTVDGGNKVWVSPITASVDEDGRAKLEVASADVASINVRTGTLLDTDVESSVRKVEAAQPLFTNGSGSGGSRQMPQLDRDENQSTSEAGTMKAFGEHVATLKQQGVGSLDGMSLKARIRRR